MNDMSVEMLAKVAISADFAFTMLDCSDAAPANSKIGSMRSKRISLKFVEEIHIVASVTNVIGPRYASSTRMDAIQTNEARSIITEGWVLRCLEAM